MDWVEEAPERELPERDEDSELGFTSLALGASASSLQAKTHTDEQSKHHDRGTFTLYQVCYKEEHLMLF